MTFFENVRSGAAQFFETLGEGWSKLVATSGRALTRFTGAPKVENGKDVPAATVESWGFLAGEVVETGSHVIVSLEVPGMDKGDFDIHVENGHLLIRGEKKFERQEAKANYHLFEAAYGAFERSVPLPRNVDAAAAEADYKRGVLIIRLPKAASQGPQTIPIR